MSLIVAGDVGSPVATRRRRTPSTVRLELEAADAALVALALEQLIANERAEPVVDRALALHDTLRGRPTRASRDTRRTR